MRYKPRVILTAILLACAGLVVICAYQFSTIIGKKIALNSTTQALSAVQAELAAACEVLAEVSSDEYHNLYARKKGYGVENERQYVAR